METELCNSVGVLKFQTLSDWILDQFGTCSEVESLPKFKAQFESLGVSMIDLDFAKRSE